MITTNYICIENATAEHPESKICFASVFQANERRQDSEGHPKAEIIKGDKTGRQDWETRLGDKAATNLKEYSCWTSGSHSLRSKNPYSWRYLGNNWSGCAKQYWKALVAVSKGAQKCPHVYIYVYIVKESRNIFTSSITCIHIATENFCLLEGTDLQMDLTFCNPMTLVVFHPLCQCVQYDPILK